jgi:hypothetical protein
MGSNQLDAPNQTLDRNEIHRLIFNRFRKILQADSPTSTAESKTRNVDFVGKPFGDPERRQSLYRIHDGLM